MSSSSSAELQDAIDRIKFEQFNNSFYIDFIVNHIFKQTAFSKVVLEKIEALINKYGSNQEGLFIAMRELPGQLLAAKITPSQF